METFPFYGWEKASVCRSKCKYFFLRGAVSPEWTLAPFWTLNRESPWAALSCTFPGNLILAVVFVSGKPPWIPTWESLESTLNFFFLS